MPSKIPLATLTGSVTADCGSPFMPAAKRTPASRGSCEATGGLASRRAWSVGLIAAAVPMLVVSRMVRSRREGTSPADPA
jgi:hypothetical protein